MQSKIRSLRMDVKMRQLNRIYFIPLEKSRNLMRDYCNKMMKFPTTGRFDNPNRSLISIRWRILIQQDQGQSTLLHFYKYGLPSILSDFESNKTETRCFRIIFRIAHLKIKIYNF